jgi:hypothetical protein
MHCGKCRIAKHPKPIQTDKTIYIYAVIGDFVAAKLYVTCVGLFLMLILSSFDSFKSFGAEKNSLNFDKTGLERLFAGYVNWNVNVPTEQLPEEGNQCVIKPGDVNFLLDPFSKGTVTQTCDVKSGSSLLRNIL